MRFLLILFCLSLPTILTAQSAPAGDALAQGDAAYAAMNFREALARYTLAAEAQPGNYQAAWKHARALVDAGEMESDKDTRKSFFDQALTEANRAIALDSSGAKGYLFKSVAMGRVALDAGARDRVRMSKEIRAAVEKSLELDPKDDIAWHVLGRWHHKVSTLSWIEKRFANMFFGGIPADASLQKAADCFKRAIAIKPDGVSHHFQLGVTYQAMGEKNLAIESFEKTLALPVGDPEDPDYQAQAREHLRDLK